jgi:hypothetical protein
MGAIAYPIQPAGQYKLALWNRPQSSIERIRHNELWHAGELHDIWFQMVTKYSELRMAKPEDKDAAISCVAQ